MRDNVQNINMLELLCTGLFWTYVALNLMVGSGQPALLYIVPCTLGIVPPLFRYASVCKHVE